MPYDRLPTLMMEIDRIRTAVYRAIAAAKELSVGGGAVVTTDATVLLGPEAVLDSMGFVNFIVALEEEMNRLTDRPLDLYEKISAAQTQSQPVSTAGQLVDFLGHVTQS